MSYYQVIVGNVGIVHTGRNAWIARERFNDYRTISAHGVGRAGGEPVTLLVNGEIVAEHFGSPADTDD